MTQKFTADEVRNQACWEMHSSGNDLTRSMLAAYAATLRQHAEQAGGVVSDEATLMCAVRAHDREDAAQRGEPDPWSDELPEPYRSERLTAMRCAFQAVAPLLRAPAEQGGKVDETGSILKNLYDPHPLMIDSGTFWRCDHGNTSFNGCRACMAASTLSAQGEAVSEVYLVPEDWGKHSAYLSIRATGKLPLAGTKLYTRAERARVPDGWVMVPREPSEAMRDAGMDAHFHAEKRASGEANLGHKGMFSRKNRAAHVYAAMLAAAPSQPEE